MPVNAANSFLHSLSMLRWLAIAGQAAAVLIAGEWLELNLPIGLLWAGIGTLVAFNLYVTVHVHCNPNDASSKTAFCHLMVDIVVLTWMLGWSGGIHNPFGVMFLILIALAALALPRGWALAAAMACMIGYLVSALLGQPVEGRHNPYALIVSGIATSFLISAIVVLYFSARIADDMRRRERELADLRERFTRNEGIVALATHAAAMAHELNTPLATMTLLADEIAAEANTDDLRSDAALLSQLLALCRERIRNLAVPTEVDLVREVSQWRLVRPTIELQRTGELPTTLRVEPSISHLIQALLNNAADAAEAVGDPRVDLHLEYNDGVLTGEVRDHGPGIDPGRSLLPATTLFNSQKLGGLGVGLALSHATVEQLGGKMTMIPAKGGGTCIRFYLPLAPLATRDTGAPE